MTLKHKLIAVTAISQIWAATALSGQAGDWQLAMIHNPSAAQLNVEQRGRVYIYDGLDEADVVLAMNGQFDRLEHMMFVRTRAATPADDSGGTGGQADGASDDCD